MEEWMKALEKTNILAPADVRYLFFVWKFWPFEFEIPVRTIFPLMQLLFSWIDEVMKYKESNSSGTQDGREVLPYSQEPYSGDNIFGQEPYSGGPA